MNAATAHCTQIKTRKHTYLELKLLELDLAELEEEVELEVEEAGLGEFVAPEVDFC